MKKQLGISFSLQKALPINFSPHLHCKKPYKTFFHPFFAANAIKK